jgi:hypothetical protein
MQLVVDVVLTAFDRELSQRLVKPLHIRFERITAR